jgi:hypothetical protein
VLVIKYLLSETDSLLATLARSGTFGSAWAELMEIKRTPIWRVLAVAKSS